MFSSPLVQIFLLTLAVTTAFAVWKGDAAVRLAALINGALTVISIPYIQHAVAGDSGEVALVVEDLVGAIGYLLLAVRYANRWIGAIMLVYAGLFSLHSYYLVMERPHDELHAWLVNTGDWIVTLCLIAGTVAAWRRRLELEREEAELEARRHKVALVAV